jgi:penicillin V acylase-like amidase (Ntn superfamily)
MATDGINEAGLTVSEHTLRQSEYMRPAATSGHAVCFSALTTWLLGNVDSVRSLRELVPTLRVLKSALPLPSGESLHWAVDDAEDHVVLEVLEGELHLHNNTVGSCTRARRPVP